MRNLIRHAPGCAAPGICFTDAILPLQGESDRLDLFHSMVVKTIGYRLFLAPVDPGRTHRILDVGTGTGICECSVPAGSVAMIN